jgi:hypothetical protein
LAGRVLQQELVDAVADVQAQAIVHIPVILDVHRLVDALEGAAAVERAQFDILLAREKAEGLVAAPTLSTQVQFWPPFER